MASYMVEWRRNNPTKHRNDRLKRLYGITLAEWDAMLAAQGNRCACCGSEDPGSRFGWNTDHDHRDEVQPGSPHVVRGIICQSCNTMLGGARDSVARLERGIAYLKSTELKEAV